MCIRDSVPPVHLQNSNLVTRIHLFRAGIVEAILEMLEVTEELDHLVSEVVHLGDL